MDKRFEERNKYQNLNYEIKKIYKKIGELNNAMGFLYNYCKAYAHLEGVEYFVPYTKQLRNLIEEIAKDLYEALNEEVEELKNDCFLDKIKPLNTSYDVTVDDD